MKLSQLKTPYMRTSAYGQEDRDHKTLQNLRNIIEKEAMKWGLTGNRKEVIRLLCARSDNEDICEEALRQLDVKWEVLPHVVDLREGRKADAPVIRPATPGSKEGDGGSGMGGSKNPPKKGNVSYSNISDGDVEAGFREADHIIECDVNTSAFSGHIPNPVGSVAWWFDSPYYGDGKNLRIEGVPWGHDQVVRMYRMPSEKVFQECMLVGSRYCDWGTRKSQLMTRRPE